MTPEELIERWREQADRRLDPDVRAIYAVCADDLATALAWRVITTAPDNTYVLAWRAGWERPVIAKWWGGGWVCENDPYWTISPTHWRPLPASPKAQQHDAWR